MPSRVIREGINASDRVDRLSELAELFYRRLMLVVDDYGRADARIAVLWPACFPLRIDPDHPRYVAPKSIREWLAECVAAKLVIIYEVAGKSYLELLDFKQQRRTGSKWPDPPMQPLPSEDTASDVSPTSPDAQQLISKRTADVQPPCTYIEGEVELRSRIAKSKSNIEGEGEKPSRVRASYPPPDGVRSEVWAMWQRHRGKKLTDDAVRLQTRTLAKLADQGFDPNDIIEKAVESGWSGLFPPSDREKHRSGRAREPTLQERKVANMDRLSGKSNGHERTIEGVSSRVGATPVLPVPGDLRESGDDDVGRSGPRRGDGNVVDGTGRNRAGGHSDGV